MPPLMLRPVVLREEAPRAEVERAEVPRLRSERDARPRVVRPAAVLPEAELVRAEVERGELPRGELPRVAEVRLPVLEALGLEERDEVEADFTSLRPFVAAFLTADFAFEAIFLAIVFLLPFSGTASVSNARAMMTLIEAHPLQFRGSPDFGSSSGSKARETSVPSPVKRTGPFPNGESRPEVTDRSSHLKRNGGLRFALCPRLQVIDMIKNPPSIMIMRKRALRVLPAIGKSILICAVSYTSAPVQAAPAPDTLSAQEIAAALSLLPEGKVTLPFVLARGYKATATFEAIESQLKRLDVPYLQSRTPLDYTLFVNGARIVDKTEPLIQFSPTTRLSTEISAGVATYFRTGTELSAEIEYSNTDLAFGAVAVGADTPQTFYQTRGELNLKQNLWRDAFGYSTRLGLDAGEKLRQATLFQYKESVEEWALNLIQVYYQAWLAQNRAKAAQANVDRRERLLRITRIKQRRGTAESPDVLQATSAVAQSEVQLSSAKQSLEEIWRQLVIMLDLPATWMGVDPVQIPIAMDDSLEEALQFCDSREGAPRPPATSSSILKFEHQARAAGLQLKRAENALKPDVDLLFTFATNGVDNFSRSEALNETVSVDHPTWIVGLTTTFPLGKYGAKADRSAALAELERSEALLRGARDNLVTTWLNTCADVRRLRSSVDLLQNALKSEEQRLTQEERRFEIGRVPMINVIQAGDDATRVELELRQAETNSRLAAWRVLRLARSMKEYLDSLPKTKLSLPASEEARP